MSEFEENVNIKIKNYFDKEKTLTKDNFNKFLISTDLIEVFDLEDNRELLWKEIMVFSNNNNQVTCNQCIEAIKCFFEYYSENIENNERKTIQSKPITDSNKEKLEEIFTRLSLTMEKKEDNEINKNEEENPQRNSTLKGLNFEQLQELKKVFNLLDLKRKEFIYISDVQELIRKYKFIKLTQNELLFFISQFSKKDNIDGKLIINYEKYSQIISKIEQQIISLNNSFFDFSPDVNDWPAYDSEKSNPIDLMEDVNKIETDCNEYTMILCDISKQIQNSFFQSLQEGLDRLTTNKDINNFKENFQMVFDESKNRLKDMDFFISAINVDFRKKATKLHLIKDAIQFKENKITNLEEEYNILYEKFSKNQNININYDVERKLIDENNILNNIIEEKNVEIENLHIELSDKDKENSQISEELREVRGKISKINEELQSLRKKYKELKYNYDLLLDDTFEKQEKIGIEQQIKPENKNKKMKQLVSPELDNLIKNEIGSHRENLMKILEFNYEKLVKYTLDVEKQNKLVTDNNNTLENRLKENESLINSLKLSITEFKEEIIRLKREKMQLLSKISDLNQNNDLNSQFRPSKILSNIFRTSNMNSISQNNLQTKKFNLEDVSDKKNNTLADLRISNLNENNNDSIFKPRRLQNTISEIDEDSIHSKTDIKNSKSNFNSANIFQSTPNERFNEFSYIINKEKESKTPGEFDIKNEDYNFQETKEFINNSENNININYMQRRENSEEEKGIEHYNNSAPEVQKQTLNKKNSTDTETFIETHTNNMEISSTKNANPTLNNLNISEDPEDNILTVDKVIQKKDEYMCYDFLSLRKNNTIIQYLEKYSEDVSSYEMFSDKIYVLDESAKKIQRLIFITSNSIYLLQERDMSITKRFNRKYLKTLIISKKDCNIISMSFSEGDDLLIEILRRTELLYYFRDLYENKKYGKLKISYSDVIKVRRNNLYTNFIINNSSNYKSSPNFDDAYKLDYLFKWKKGFLLGSFKEKLVVLTDIGLMYFDEPNKPSKRIIKIIGSEIIQLDQKEYKRKYCFKINTLNQETYVFAAKSEESLYSWLVEFQKYKKKYEEKKKNLDKNRLKK